MHIAIFDATAQLNELVRRAEAGDEVILTRGGHAAVRLVPVQLVRNSATRRAVMEALQAESMALLRGEPDGAPSQDFLYGEDGLPA
jgi:prevent-host-death family protein